VESEKNELQKKGGASFQLPEYSRTVLGNGLTILCMPRPGLPLVNLRLLLRVGGLADPPGRQGLASLTAEALRRGTAQYSASAFSEALDSLGGTMAIGADQEYTVLSAEFMTRHLQSGLELLHQALCHPVFPEEEIARLAIRRSDTIRQAKDNPSAVIQAYFESFLYQDHPYGQPASGDEVSTASVTREEIVSFWKSRHRADRAILSVVVDLQESHLLSAVSELFSTWEDGIPPEAPLADGAEPSEPRVLLVDKPDTNQTYFRIGGLGIERTHLDYVQLQVLNTIFGGRFTSRLNAALRINSGLTYGARSFFIGLRKRGPFAMASYTPTETTARAVDLTLEQLQRFHAEGVGEEELASVKTYIRGQFPPTLETIDQLAGVMAELEFYGLNASFVNTYLEQVDALNPNCALQLIHDHFPSRNLVFTFIGQGEKIREAVGRYGTVTARSITTPGF
jgi:zinc protease